MADVRDTNHPRDLSGRNQATVAVEDTKTTLLQDVMEYYDNRQLDKAQPSKISQERVRANRLNFPDNDNHKELKACLGQMQVSPELAKFLVWIPFSRFTDIRVVKKDGRSTTSVATVTKSNHRGFASHRNEDWPDNCLELSADGIHYDGENQRRYMIKEYSDEHSEMLQVQVGLDSLRCCLFCMTD